MFVSFAETSFFHGRLEVILFFLDQFRVEDYLRDFFFFAPVNILQNLTLSLHLR